jgi:SAM-dependent methyltransferase
MKRHRVLWIYLHEETDIFEAGGRILHFAPLNKIEERLHSEDGIEYISTDLRRNSVDVNADITELPFHDQIFDLVICSHVLEHIPDDQAALNELYRILGDDGIALVLVPKNKNIEQTFENESITSPIEREKAFDRANHV